MYPESLEMLTLDVQFPRIKLRIRKPPTLSSTTVNELALRPLTTPAPQETELEVDNSVEKATQQVIKLQIRNLQAQSSTTLNCTPDDELVSITRPASSSIEENSGGSFAMNPRQQKYYNLLAQVAEDRGYQILGSYIDAHTKIQMRCPEKHDLEISPGDFKTGYGCARCAGRCGVQSREKLYTHAYDLGYEVLGTYISNHKKIQMQCPEKHYFEITPANFKSGHGCAQCAGTCPVQAERQLYVQAQQRGFRVLGDYVDSGTKIQMQCSNKHLFEITPANFKSDHGCAQCTGQCPLQAREDLYAQAGERNYRVLGIYTNNHTKIQMLCREQHIVEITPADLKSGRGCAKCAENCPIQAGEQFYAQAQERGFRVIEPYINNRIKVQMQCPERHLFEIQPAGFKNGHGCRVCTESAGEQVLRGLLTVLQLPFEPQYILPSLQNRKYDFVIIQSEKMTFIEWDGQQHFIYPNLFHKSEEEFIQGQELDILKTQEVMRYRYQMIRIDYTWLKKNVEEISQFIRAAIQSPEWLIFSNPTMYTWLSSQIRLPSSDNRLADLDRLAGQEFLPTV